MNVTFIDGVPDARPFGPGVQFATFRASCESGTALPGREITPRPEQVAAARWIGLGRTMPRPAGGRRPGHLCGQSSVCMRGWRDYVMLSLAAPRGGSYSRSVKEVIQPQVPLRLPCYDFAPVTELTFGGCLLAVSPPTSGPPSFHGVTGGVYKARERIHRGVADPRLLAIPASCRRVADDNPN